jgi:ABC-2 type transport system permease protein
VSVIGPTTVKDIQLLLQDRGRLLAMFAMPVAFIVAFGTMIKTGPDHGEPRPIAIWHAAGDVRGEAIEKALDGSSGFVAKPLESADKVRSAVAHDEVVAGLVVPASGSIELSIDLAAPIQVRGPIQGALTGAVMRALVPPAFANVPPPLEAKSPPGIAKPLDDISSFQVTVPGNAVLFGFFISMTVAMTFASERRTGTWRRLLAAPVPRWKALVGTIVPYFFVGCVQLAFLFGLGAGVFGMKVAGDVSALIVLSLAVVTCGMSFGLLVAALGGSEKQIGSTVPVVLLVMGLLGGCMFPRLFMPDFMKKIGHIVPHSWALDGYYDVLVRQGTTIVDIAPSIGALLAFSAVFAGIGLSRFRFEQ